MDLQGLYKLEELNVITYWMRTDKRYYHYDLYASTDGENFEKIAAKDWDTPETVFGETFDLREQEVYATHIKLVGLYDSANSSFHLNELRVYGTEVLPEPEPEIVAEGWSGYTTWRLTDDGTITFTPSGEKLENGETNLKNYWKVNGVLTLPWTEYADLITKVVIEEGIHDIGQMAFYALPNLREVVLPESIVEIRNYAFKNCASLTAINLEHVDFIREGAFYGCSALENVSLADNVTIEDWAFTKVPGYQP